MIFPRSQLSKHAEERLAERFRIDPQAFLSLLNCGHGKKIGKSSKTHLIHRLLWSYVDEALLVAIQNVVDGTVLTVIPLEMYCARYERNVTDLRIHRVINKMVHAGLAPSRLWSPGDKEETVTIYARLSEATQPVALGGWKEPVSSPDLSRLGTTATFWEWVVSKVESKGHNPDHIETVTGKFSGGNHQGIPHRLRPRQDQEDSRRAFSVESSSP